MKNEDYDLASNASVATLCLFASGKQCGLHEDLKNLIPSACRRSQRLVGALPQAPINISDFI
ncbi:MAG: hypothetical protein Q4E45_00600 [Eubacteriales bacterium]|nr:hypothetical protein [Eubacteriales bacterium]